MLNTANYTYGRLKPIRGEGGKKAIRLNANLSLAKGTAVVAETGATQNEVHTITVTGSPTGGTFTLTFLGYTTSALAHNSTAALVQTALEALPSIGAGNVSCTGGALPGTPVVVTFINQLAGQPQPVTVGVASFSGGSSPAISIAKTTTGRTKGFFKLYAGSGAPVLLECDTTTNQYGQHQFGLTTQSQYGGFHREVPSYHSGIFRLGDTTGLDSSAITAIQGVFLTGSLSDPDSELKIPGAN